MSTVTVRPLQKSDHAEWRRLWTEYLVFYKATVPEEVYASTWKRLFTEGEFEPKGFFALLDGRPVGLVHYLYHRSCWSVVEQLLFAGPVRRSGDSRKGRRRSADRSGTEGSWQARCEQRLLDDP